jgi:hypothetical protein
MGREPTHGRRAGMKTRGILVFSVVTVFLLASAALALAGEVKFGAHAGLTIPNLRGGQDNPLTSGFSSREAEFFGISADIGLSRHFSLVVELNYTSQGGKRTGLQIIEEMPAGLPVPPDTDLYADFKNETILDYVEIPVMLRYKFGNTVRFFINAGPYAGYLVRAHAVTSGSSLIYLDPAGTEPVIDTPVSFVADTDVKDSLKTTNFGLAGGAGIMYPLGPGSLVFEAHFQAGLITIQKDVETSGKSQTGAVVISLGYLFSLR